MANGTEPYLVPLLVDAHSRAITVKDFLVENQWQGRVLCNDKEVVDDDLPIRELPSFPDFKEIKLADRELYCRSFDIITQKLGHTLKIPFRIGYELARVSNGLLCFDKEDNEVHEATMLSSHHVTMLSELSPISAYPGTCLHIPCNLICILVQTKFRQKLVVKTCEDRVEQRSSRKSIFLSISDRIPGKLAFEKDVFMRTACQVFSSSIIAGYYVELGLEGEDSYFPRRASDVLISKMHATLNCMLSAF